jgi:hypothetical protein
MWKVLVPQLPPRNTRAEPELGPGGFTDGLDA